MAATDGSLTRKRLAECVCRFIKLALLEGNQAAGRPGSADGRAPPVRIRMLLLILRQVAGQDFGSVDVPGTEQGQHIMQLREDKPAIVEAAFGMLGQFFPAIPDRDAGQFKPGEQRGAIGNIAVVPGFLGPDLPIIQRQHLAGFAALEMEQRHMPGDMETQVVGMGPEFGVTQPFQTIPGAAGHFQHMRHCMASRDIARRERHSHAAGLFCLCVMPGLLEGESVAAENEPGKRPGQIELPRGEARCRQHIPGMAEHEADHLGEFQGQHIARVQGKGRFQHGRGIPRAGLQPGGQGINHRLFFGQDRFGHRGGSGRPEAGHGGGQQFRPCQSEQQQTLGGMTDGKVRILRQGFGEMIGRRGSMGHQRFEKGVPGGACCIIPGADAVAGESFGHGVPLWQWMRVRLGRWIGTGAAAVRTRRHRRGHRYGRRGG